VSSTFSTALLTEASSVTSHVIIAISLSVRSDSLVEQDGFEPPVQVVRPEVAISCQFSLLCQRSGAAGADRRTTGLLILVTPHGQQRRGARRRDMLVMEFAIRAITCACGCETPS
jgi:hypothetical protein